MSVAIATMGMFTPASGETIIRETGSSGYGYAQREPKPRVIVRRVEQNELEAEIKIVLLHVEEK